MFTRIGAAAYKKDLHNTVELLAALGQPQQSLKCIHVAGTNGKGSTSHMLAAIFQACGYRVGLYTSPHLHDFRERIKTTGNAGEVELQMIPQATVVEFVEQIKPSIEAIEPSFFELTVAMAFHFFAHQNLDIAIIETGLGGRLDSTNVITPLLSIITNIGWDHMNLLGNTLPEIAAEKAGIIKPLVPVVVGEAIPETKPVFEQKAAKEQAPLHWAQDNLSVVGTQASPQGLRVVYINDQNQTTGWDTDLAGLYQQHNLRTVLTAVNLLQKMGFDLPEHQVRRGLSHVKAITNLMGRWQVLRQHPSVVLDVAHNVNGITQVLAQIAQMAPESVHLVMGMVKDKDIAEVLALLPKHFQYYFTQAQLPRALPAEQLLEAAKQVGLQGASFNHVNDAVALALQNAGKNDLVVVCGSVFVVAEVDMTLVKA
ncbi:MAG: bifunctional folylpolyglutamate synthase/dihydrofolate synthase [Bacteroidetes bacterium]|nr:MAG: bifunctional folylpolyglutamate synthase/dihydrofolate synthase [Bacteroidota bacterium]